MAHNSVAVSGSEASWTIVEAFHRSANLRREDIFENDQLTPLTAAADARTAAPGWVGSRWTGGTLLVGINPGGGGDDYRRNPQDEMLYAALRNFRDARTPPARAQAFATASAAWIAIQRTHNVWRIIGPILEAAGETEDTAAFINILPFRTRMDRPAPASTLRRAWSLASAPQIAALAPQRIVALGKKAWDVLSRFYQPAGELILFKRGIGDSYIPAESQAVLMSLRESRPPG